ncbi:dysbindin domain-containing protein 1 isoform X2 [Dicentrarchus labrax]|uniref:dysbindin domain-containing protein 1 isoform X2 n=1 Tax=Dicentrarchus labrax TaxID=13489 RepID=UPI0021F5FAAD|nr:dysbindin domain-containing protein 1 isoform X2 [Dicentrarchus labrax]
MEAQGGAGSPEPNKDIQKLLKPSSSCDLSKELFQHPAGGEEEEGGLSGHTASLLHITEKRQPLSSVSSLEVHFDLLDLTELTDMSDQELAEVFADSDEENHNESPAAFLSKHHHTKLLQPLVSHRPQLLVSSQVQEMQQPRGL